jgi:hypothetical protein
MYSPCPDHATVERWPNGLGWNVDETEVWQTRLDGKWGVRCIHNGEAHKWMLIDPSEHLFMTVEHAAALCCGHGKGIE